MNSVFEGKKFKQAAKAKVSNVIVIFLIFIVLNLIFGYTAFRTPIRTTYYIIQNRNYLPIFAYKHFIAGILCTGLFSGVVAFVIRTLEPYFETKACLYSKDHQAKVDAYALFKSSDWNEFFSYFLKQLVANLIIGAVVAISSILLAISLIAFVTYSAYGITIMSSHYVQYRSGLGTGLIVLFVLSLCTAFLATVMHYRYALVPFIALEQPKLGVIDTLKLSAASMKGFKWELFIMDLSFIGWNFLVVITGGLVGIYVAPYHALAMTEMYRSIVIHDFDPTSTSNVNQILDAEKIDNDAEEEKKELKGMNFCPYCGCKLVDSNANYCPNCGKKLR